jgi:hypothetical protein
MLGAIADELQFHGWLVVRTGKSGEERHANG